MDGWVGGGLGEIYKGLMSVFCFLLRQLLSKQCLGKLLLSYLFDIHFFSRRRTITKQIVLEIN